MLILKWEVIFQVSLKVWEDLVTWVASLWEEWEAMGKPSHLK